MKPYYDDGKGIVIYHGKCEEVLPQLPKSDLLLTDPPYGIGVSCRGVWGTSNKGKVSTWEKTDWDAKPPADWLFGLMLDYSVNQIIWGGNYFPLPPSRCWLVWDKDNTGDFADCELAWTNLDKAVRKIRYRWNGMLQEKMGADKEIRHHPTQKPLDVITWAIKHAPETCQTILDPFMGSGTTLRAAKDLGRKAIGIEIEERYCEIAAKRLAQEVFAL